MGRHWIINASPLIALGKVGLISMLERMAQQTSVPPAVDREVRAGADQASRSLAAAKGLILLPPMEPHPVVSMWGLGLGETQVLTAALADPASEAILDDAAARRCADVLGVPCRGTLGVVLLAKQQGLISSVAEVISQLRDVGLYVSSGLVTTALRLAGEDHQQI